MQEGDMEAGSNRPPSGRTNAPVQTLLSIQQYARGMHVLLCCFLCLAFCLSRRLWTTGGILGIREADGPLVAPAGG